MRKDALGLFWRDEPVVKVKKEVVKRTPPKPTWLEDDYLPYYEQAKLFPFRQFTDQELVAARGCTLILDIECYPNYYLAAFKCPETKRIVYVEAWEGGPPLDISKLNWILHNFRIVTFNGNNYDLVITTLALAGKSLKTLKEATDQIIVEEMAPWDVLRQHKLKKIEIDHIDIIEVCPLYASLKIYAGRIHCKRMQDLPFSPNKRLNPDQITVTRYYCVNDLDNTIEAFQTLSEQIKLREDLGHLYGIDIRSRSDAQIAEDVFAVELARLNGKKPVKPIIPAGTVYHYKIPPFLQYKSALLNWALDKVRAAQFVVEFHGSVGMPKELDDLELEINGSVYRMGIGGLHSSEHKVSHRIDDEYNLHDFDVTSYYPRIVINQRLYPYHLGPNFIFVYNNKVEERVTAKKIKDMVKANGFKIVVNGGFGKLGNKYSIMYAPDLLIQVTLTGQLSLLMLIERLEWAGIHVVSANTDGIVVKCKRSMEATMYDIVKQWEKDTGFTMEEARYMALYSRDVNNYIAVKQTFDDNKKVWIEKPKGCKTKGAYANPWKDDSDKSQWMHKNPTNTICIDAIEEMLVHGTPVVTTIERCQDIRKFLSVRKVKGGAVKVYSEDHTEYLGSAIRWYYAKDVGGELVYAKSGNKVPKSDGAKPCMELPEQFPSDVDIDWYIGETEKILREIAYV